MTTKLRKPNDFEFTPDEIADLQTEDHSDIDDIMRRHGLNPEIGGADDQLMQGVFEALDDKFVGFMDDPRFVKALRAWTEALEVRQTEFGQLRVS